MMESVFYFDHFLKAQESHYDDVLLEIKAGRKTSHWIWYIFPIFSGLGKSNISEYFAINSLSEATAFSEHELLGARYLECVEAMIMHKKKSVRDVLGRDSWKFRASLTLFGRANQMSIQRTVIRECLRHFYEGRECNRTRKKIMYSD